MASRDPRQLGDLTMARRPVLGPVRMPPKHLSSGPTDDDLDPQGEWTPVSGPTGSRAEEASI
jgi:hypothetical protein